MTHFLLIVFEYAFLMSFFYPSLIRTKINFYTQTLILDKKNMKLFLLKARLYDINFQEVPEIKVVKRKASKNLAFNDQIEEPEEIPELEVPLRRYSKNLSFEPESKVPQKKYSKRGN